MGELAADQAGVVHRRQLRALGITRDDVRTEIAAGRWVAAGRHTVLVNGVGALSAGPAAWWRAVWESGAGARLDGAAALVAHGMSGFRPELIDVSVPHSTTHWQTMPGVRVSRRRQLPPLFPAGVPRSRSEWATIRAAQLATSDRQAALLICMPVQQRLLRPASLLTAWATVERSPRRNLLDAAIRDVCDGAHSLGELDFGAWCRVIGIPLPDRQVVRSMPSGRVYLDCHWEDVGLTVEIDGAQHAMGLNALDDAWRQNELVLGADVVLRIPVLALRLEPIRFLTQVRRAREYLAERVA